MDFGNRIVDLEKRVKLLESNSMSVADVEGKIVSTTSVQTPSTRSRNDTREKALTVLRSKLKNEDEEASVLGYGNRGKSRLYFQNENGAKKYIYLSTSRNYSEEGDEFSSWHTISPDDITDGIFDVFILSAEDEAGEPLLFIFSLDEMKKFIKRKTPDSRPYYHFYLTRKGEDGYEDWRKDPTYPSQEVTDYLENWSALLG